MTIKKLIIIYFFTIILFYLLKIFLMNYQKTITKKINYIQQRPKLLVDKKETDIDKQHEPYLGGDVNEYGMFTLGFTDHPNDMDMKLADLHDNMKIIDAGCGLLGPSINFSKKLPNLKIFAISNGYDDHKKIIINKIKDNHLDNKIIPIFSDYHQMDQKFKPNSIDRIIFIESIGFSNQIQNLLNKCYKVLKPGGKIYIRTIVVPNFENQYLNQQFEKIENSLEGNLYYHQNIIHFLQKSNYKDIKVSTIPLTFSDNMYNLPFLKTIDRLGLYQWDLLVGGYFLLSGSYVATK